MPDLRTLDIVNVPAGFKLAAGTPTLVVFWANYAEGDYQTIVVRPFPFFRLPFSRVDFVTF